MEAPTPSPLITTNQAARILFVSPLRVRQFILEGRLPAAQFGRSWMLPRAAVLKFAMKKRKPGRPKKRRPVSTEKINPNR